MNLKYAFLIKEIIMKIRMKDNIDQPFVSSRFNIHGLGEVVGFGDQFGSDCFFIKDLDVFIEANNVGWKDMRQAFKDKDIIVDNYNTYFFEPSSEKDRKRGFTLN